MAGEWQLRFDGGRQQRYLPDRCAVLRYVLAIGGQTREPVFEIWREDAPVRLADGRSGGRRFVREEVIDLRVDGTRDRVRAELAGLAGTGGPEGTNDRR
ncbi:MAG TPA: hypothetical protein VJT31_21275 [Rugosimonospora sp.]|nr:hypothetical protein [Rugosimonospora sp.]